ncbi:alpha/beta hydrolase [Paraburkholderia sp.]|uniref:alpha/beta hydrolase n=1 Tax=Paraburkholderia sp. TaxID=1926495 RepID=UPI00239D0DC6|nr:alpha/beta hydrolase [Paraburkholderia sp.]MDE1183607.1 lysophospholipase [Paraburkholderia sp.]
METTWHDPADRPAQPAAQHLAQTGASSQHGQPERSTVTTRDRIELPLYRWPAKAPRIATVALVHGLAEHAGRYAALAARLNAAGVELVAIDLRGHGDAPGKRARIQRFDDYLHDTAALLEDASHSDAPLFLMGHSMGGAIAALYAIERLGAGGRVRGRALSGLILSSPALVPGRDVPRWMLALSQLISRIWPGFPAMKIDASLLSRIPAVVKANLDDPLVHHGPVPARTGAELLLAMKRIEHGRDALRVPLLVFHGTDDKLTEPDGSREFATYAGSPDKTLALHAASYHETMNDLDRDRVIGELVQWITTHATHAV